MIICCGEALIDMVPAQLVNDEEGFHPVPGGAIFNTAVALGRLGAEVGFFSSLSEDIFGDKLIATLNNANVNTSFCTRSSQPTTLAFVNLQDGHAEYYFLDENSALRSLSKNNLPDTFRGNQALHFGGISLIPESCGSAYETLMEQNFKTSVISFDPNIRPDFIENELSFRERINRMMSYSDIIKLSGEDLLWLFPNKSFEEVAEKFIEKGTSLVVLTKGEHGAEVITPKHNLRVSADKVEIVDTIGAGDTFNSGLLFYLQKNALLTKHKIASVNFDDLQASVRFASKVAAYTVGQAGANSPHYQDLM